MSNWRKKQKHSPQDAKLPSTGVLSPLEMFHLGSGKKGSKIKGVVSTVPFAQDHSLMDLSLATKGNMEDRDFALDPALRTNLRRGNTLAVVLDPIASGRFVEESRIHMEHGKPHEVSRVEWVRKGMRKFFDMCLPYVQHALTPNIDGLGSFGGNYTKQFRGRDEYLEELRKVIFFEVEQSLLRDRVQIDVYKTNKANGENAQVSYYPRVGAWIIASKNVSLAARTADDIDLYNLSRYDFAKLIAVEWFRLIAPLTPTQIQSLKDDLTNRTIVGEYVGHPDHQHLVRYSAKDIMFYAYVDHEREDTCLPPVQAFRLFRKYGLSHVKTTLHGSYRTPSDLYSALETLFMRTSSEDIAEGEEGSVLYFVRNTLHPDAQALHSAVFASQVQVDFAPEVEAGVYQSQQTLALAKLKTLEYRLYRKLREKLKHFSPDKSPEGVLKVFKAEMRELCEGQELPKPADFYHEVARVALQFAARTPKALDKLQDHYIDFLDKIIARVSDSDPSASSPETSTPIEIVLVTPPELYPDSELQSLAVTLSYSFQPAREWKGNKVVKERTMFKLVHAQRVDHQFDKFALIVHLGFSDAGKRDCLQALSRLAASGVKVEDEEIKRFVDSADISAKVETLWNDVSQARAYLSYAYPENLLELPGLENAAAQIESRLRSLQEPKAITEKAELVEEKKEIKETVPRTPSATAGGKTVIVVVPMGIPGMGKTFLITKLQSLVSALGCTLSVVSSDKVRRECMENWMAQKHSADLEKAFEATGKKARTVFFDRIKEAMRSTSPVHLLFIDKNHPPNAVRPTLEELDTLKPRDVVRVETIALVPECRNGFTVGRGERNLEFEMSLTFLVQCMLRTRDRPSHETLIGSPTKLLSVVLMMFNMYRNVHFDDYKNTGFNYVVRVPFTDESGAYYPEPLISSISALLSDLKPGSMPELDDVKPIESSLRHVPTAFAAINNSELVLTAFTAIIRKYAQVSLPPAAVVEEVKEPKQTVAKSTPFDPKKSPIFLGIDVEQWFGPSLLGLMRAALYTLSDIFSKDDPLARDYRELVENLYAPTFACGQMVSPTWKYTDSLHLTTKFIGGNRKNAGDLSAFRNGEEVTLRAKLLAYVPQRIVCVMCDLLTQGVPVENQFPHITCLLGKWRAKNSNDVLSGISFEAGVAKQQATICGEDVTVYTIRLLPEWVIRGLTKAYY